MGRQGHERLAVSLVVNTRDRAAVLPPFLAALQGLQCAAPWELVLVDNGSSDDTLRLLRGFCAQAPAPCAVLLEPRRGSSFAKNAGWRAASAPIVCFTDDDCYPAPDLLEQMLQAFCEPETGFVAGRVLLHDPLDLPTAIKPDAEPRRYPARHAFPPGELHGANFAFRRAALEAVGGFDELAGAGTPFQFEDIDAIMRVSLAGWAGRYDPRPTVSHHHRRRGSAALDAALRGYARGRGAYFAKFLTRQGPRLELLKRWVGCVRYHGPRWLPAEIAGALGYLYASWRRDPVRQGSEVVRHA